MEQSISSRNEVREMSLCYTLASYKPFLVCGHQLDSAESAERLLRLTAECRGNMFLQIFVTSCAVQNRSKKCNTLKKHLRYKSGPYLTQSVYVISIVVELTWVLFQIMPADGPKPSFKDKLSILCLPVDPIGLQALFWTTYPQISAHASLTPQRSLQIC